MNRLAVLQPYFFPYLGYFGLMKHVDAFVVLDPVQHIQRGWVHRNRILKEGADWLYIVVPTFKAPRETLIKDVRVDTTRDWQKTIMGQLSVYKKIAPYYREVSNLVEQAISPIRDSLVDVNVASLEVVKSYLGITTPLMILSKMNLEFEQPRAPDEWALNTVRALGGTEYWNPPGGQSFYDRDKYNINGVQLKFHQQNLRPYDQRRDSFEAGLSIIDVLMFNSPRRVHEMLDDYELF